MKKLREYSAETGLRPGALEQDAIEDLDLKETIGLLFKEPLPLIYRSLYNRVLVAGERNFRPVGLEKVLVDVEARSKGFECGLQPLYGVFLVAAVEAFVIDASNG
jgi:hypothetical protein